MHINFIKDDYKFIIILKHILGAVGGWAHISQFLHKFGLVELSHNHLTCINNH